MGNNGARYAQIARNYARDGLLAFGGAPRLDVAAAERGGGESRHSRPVAEPDVAPNTYLHHPPGLSLVIALGFLALGVDEDVARAVPILATLVVLALLARLVAREAGAGAGALAALAAAAMPMVSIYGAHVDVQGPPVLALSLATLLGYRRWLAGGSAAPFLAAAAAASAFDWYGLYTPAACALHLVLTRPDRRRAALLFGAEIVTLFGLWLLWLDVVGASGGSAVGELFGAAGVRGAFALQGGEAFAAHVRAWWSDTNAAMPGWPALLVLALLVAMGVVRAAPPTPCARPVLGPRALLGLLLLPPLLHAALFPAGLLIHDYWLFGLPPALAAGFALVAPRLGRAPAAALALLLLVPGVLGARSVLERRDELSVLVGRELAERTAPGDVVFTDYDCNPFDEGGERLEKRPAVTFYSDREVLGLVGTGAPQGVSLGEALARRPMAAWFLLTPWPPAPLPGLSDELRARAQGAPLRLSESPPVDLFRLAP